MYPHLQENAQHLTQFVHINTFSILAYNSACLVRIDHSRLYFLTKVSPFKRNHIKEFFCFDLELNESHKISSKCHTTIT